MPDTVYGPAATDREGEAMNMGLGAFRIGDRTRGAWWKRATLRLLFTALTGVAALSVPTPLASAQTATSDGDGTKPEPPMADVGWLKWCVDTRGGSTLADAPCYLEYREALEREQASIISRIYRALGRAGPKGTDYAAAARQLRAAQAGWKSQVDGDCDALSSVFGKGTALGLAGEDCIIDHYRARNEWLSTFERDWLRP